MNYLDTNSYKNNNYNKKFNHDNNKDLKTINPNTANNQNNSYAKNSIGNTNNTNNNNNIPYEFNNTTYKNNPYDINITANKNKNSTNLNSNENQNINNNSIMNQNRKPLSIKVAKDVINELYNSKVNYDKICLENKLPNETLEQYMYIFLNNKYGLKNLVLDWASAIINAIKLYSNEDCEINLFGKILRNEQEENSRLILIKLKENIAELLEYYYKSKYPLKSKEEIDSIMNQKKNGILLEEEWKGIIYYIYNAEDSQIIENKILDFIQEQNNKILFILENGEDVNNDRFITYQNNNRNNTTEKTNLSKKLNTNMTDVFLTEKKRVTRQDLNNINRLKEEVNIPYSDFIQLVCENQIQNREKYLKKFVKLFRKFDKDGDGVLNEEQFIGMIKAIPYCQNNIEEYIDKFLAIIDPFNHKKFTFNNCVTLLSSEIIDENQMSQSYYNQALLNVDSPNIGLNIQNETTLLDKICLGT
jgi:Ca2+-binding EF-hand superfamily protein